MRNPAVGHVFPSQDGRLSSEYNEMDLQHQIRSLQEEVTSTNNCNLFLECAGRINNN